MAARLPRGDEAVEVSHRRLTTGDTVDDDGNRAVARYVACRPEAVHRDVERNHQRLKRFVEAEHRLQDAERCHNRTAGNAGGGDHCDAEHHDKAGHRTERDGFAGHIEDGHRAGGDFHRAAREVDGGAERDDKDGNRFAHAVFDGLRQRHRDGGGRRLRAQRGGVGGKHVLQEAHRVLPADGARDGKLNQQQQDMEDEDDDDDLEEHKDDTGDVAADRHVQEDPEDMEREERDDDRLNQFCDDLLEVGKRVVQHAPFNVRQSQPDDEGEKQGTHDVHQRRHGDGEVGLQHEFARVLDGGQLRIDRQQFGEDGGTREVGKETGEKRRAVGEQRSEGEQAPGPFPQVTDGGRDQSDDNQRDGERKEVAEQ